MMEHLGAPEDDERLVARHRRYVDAAAGSSSFVFVIRAGGHREVAGQVVFWETTWRDEPIYEMGWSVLPEYQGRGIASAAVALAVAAAAAAAAAAAGSGSGARRRLDLQRPELRPAG